jgi:hypothetical protein
MSTITLPPPAAAPSRFPLPGRVASFIGTQLAAHTARRLRRLGNGVAAQAEAFSSLRPALADTRFGRDAGLERALTYETFRTRLPARTYEDFSPYIERMKLGEAGVLSPGRCEYFAVSSGTTAGPSKWLPVNEPMLAHFRDAGLDALLFYALRAGEGSVFRGRHLFLGGSSALMALPEAHPPIYYGDLSGITALNIPEWAARFLYEPGLEIAHMADWPAKLAAIARRTWRADITMVAGIPSWLLVLAATLRAHVEAETGAMPVNLRELWPNLECLVHGGVPVAPFVDELRAAYGRDINFHEVYPASEAFIAVQDAAPEAGLRLLVDRGVFFEFLPLRDYDETNLAGCAARAVPLEGVRAGVDYVLLLTTPAGLVRYVIGDVVRFIGTEPPRLVYVGRTKLQLSAFGEHVIEKELTDTLAAVCRRHHVAPVNFHVAPVFPDPAAGRPLGCHEWWLELRRDEDGPLPDVVAFAADLDSELSAHNDDYAAKRAGHGLTPPVVRLVEPGVFERWLRGAGKWGGQNKMPRCRSDRRVADELSEFTGF